MIDAARIRPREATEEMIAAVWIDKEDVSPKEIWQAMWDAAPASPSADAGEVERQPKLSGPVEIAIGRLHGACTMGNPPARADIEVVEAALRPASSEEQVQRAIKETRRYTTGALTREEHEDLVRSVARAILTSGEHP